MPTFCEVAINKSFKKEFLESLVREWDIGGNYTEKNELVQVIIGSFDQEIKPHVRIYLVQHEGNVYGVSGKKPTVNPKHDPKGILSFIKKFKREPDCLKDYLNNPVDLVTDDPVVNEKVKDILSGDYPKDNLLLLLKDVPARPPDTSSEASDTEEYTPGSQNLTNKIKNEQDTSSRAGTVPETQQSDPSRVKNGPAALQHDHASPKVMTVGSPEPQNHSEAPASRSSESSQAPKEIACHFLDKSSQSIGFSKLIKLEKFDRDKLSAEEWLDNAAYSFDLAGFRDSKSYLPCILSKLPDELQSQTRGELARLGLVPEKVTFSDIKRVIMDLTKCSRIELERKLANIKYEPSMKLRKLWLNIERIVKLMNPSIVDQNALNRITAREFRQKLPESIRQNVTFKASALTDIELTDLGETVRECCSIKVVSNALDRGKGRNGRGRGRGGYSRGGRGGYAGGRGGYTGGSGRDGHRDSNDKDKKDQEGNVVEICWCCGKPGHRMNECYVFKRRKEESRANRNGGRSAESKSNHD